MSDPQRQDPRIEAVLSQLSHAANLGITPEELLTRAIDGLLQLARAPAGVACLADPEGETLEVVSVPPSDLSDSSLGSLQRETSTALQNARVRHGLQSLNMDLFRLLTLAKMLGEPRELEETLTTVAQAAKSFAGAVATVVWLADPEARSLTRIVSLQPQSPDRFPRRRFAYGEGLAGWVEETGEALHLEDALNDPPLVAKDWARSRNGRCASAFPLRFKEALVGVLSGWTSSPLPPPQFSLLGIYCDHAALAIGHARLLRGKEAHAEQLAILLAVARTINERTAPEVRLRVISEACRRATGAPWFSVWWADTRKRQLRLLHADPANQGSRTGESA